MYGAALLKRRCSRCGARDADVSVRWDSSIAAYRLEILTWTFLHYVAFKCHGSDRRAGLLAPRTSGAKTPGTYEFSAFLL